jgi:VCBS repeat-containing protein/predicted outer membrane repeat protein
MVFRRRKLTDRVQTVVDEVLHLLQNETQSGFQMHRPSAVQAARLEERVLMSASPMAIVAEGAVQAVEASVAVMETGVDSSTGSDVVFDGIVDENVASEGINEQGYSAISSDAVNLLDPNSETGDLDSNEASGPELIVIDYRVQDADTLLESLLRDGRDVRLLRLDADSDGLSQISNKLEQIGNVSAIHLLTHGRDGEILLGSTRLNSTTLAQHAPELLAWQHSLTSNADLLIYGCDVAESIEGRDFLDSLSALTGADLAASTDATGGSIESADWILEYNIGQIDQPGIFTATVMDRWQHSLVAGGTVTVTTTNDVVDGTVTSIAALIANQGADGRISLREAILAANANADVDEIILAAGEYRIQITGRDDTGLGGDFDIAEGVTIRGAGSGTTIINGGSIDRIFDLRGSADATVIGVTITGGNTTEDGGGLRVSKNAVLTLSQAVVSGNSTTRKAGGLFNDGTATLTNVSIVGNNSGSDGGGINNSGGLELTNVTIAGNTANRGGGLHHDGAGSTLEMTSVTVSGNTATTQGGGIYAGRDASLLNVTIANNEAGAAGAGILVHSSASSFTIRNTLLSGNELTNGTSANVSGTVSSLGNNLDSDGTAALNQSSDLSGVNPLLQPLANNGGFTQTHALASNSVALDAGSSVAAPTVDQRGFVRDRAADIGAYEFDRAFLTTSQFSANSTTSADQMTSAETRGSQNAIARDHAGNYVVVWSSNSQDGSGWGVYARRFDANGQPLTGEFRINSVTSDNQQWASVAADSNGNFVVTWTSTNQDGTGQSIYARRYSAAGVAQGGEFLVNTTTTGIQKNSTISMNSSGQFVIAWQGEGPGDSSGVFFRRYAANGTAIDTTDKRANVSSTGTQINPGVAIDGTGNVVVLWQDTAKLYFQRILTSESDINGTSGTWSTSRVQIDSTLSTSDAPALAMDAAGNFTVAYREQTILPGIWVRGFNANGTQKYSWFQAASGSATSPSMAMASDGQFILSWQNTGDGDGTGIYARKYLANGSANGAAFQVNQYTTGNQTQSSLTMIDPNNFVVVWSGASATDTSGISIRQYGTGVAQILQAQNDYVTTATNTSISIDPLVNDSRSADGVAILLDVSDPANGTAAVSTDGTISYTPNTAYAGDDSLTYLISDGKDGTSHYWSLGGNAVDSVGSADGVLNGTTTVAGSFGTALQFNKTSDYVRIPDFAYTPSFTVSFDFKIDNNTGSVYQYLYSHGTWSTTNSLQVLLGETGTGSDANVLRTYFGDTNDAYSTSALNTNIASLIGDGQWHTYTLVVDKATGTQVYIDGVQRVSAATRGGDAFNPSGDLYLGVRSDLNSARYFGGQLDSVRIIDRALSLPEVGALNTGNSPSAGSTQSTATVYVTVQNASPVVSINGPYQSSVGLPVTFSGSGTSDLNNDTLTYEWDLNYDGVTFNSDATGMTISKTWAELQASGTQVGTNSIALKVTDSRGAETMAVTTLQVSVNAAPTALSLSNYVIPGAQAGTVVGTLTTTDSTTGDFHTYTVTDNRFEVVSGQLKLKAGQSVNRDTETSVSMSITTRDLAGNELTRALVLTVGNGPIVARNNTVSTNENTPLTGAAPGVLSNDDVPAGAMTSGAVLDFNAAQDTNGDTIWQNSTANTGFGLNLGTGVTRSAVTPSHHYGILSSFDFNGSATSGAYSSVPVASLPGNPTDGTGAMELWFRPDELTKKYILIDSGTAQPGSGLSLRLNGTQLEYSVYSGTAEVVVTSDISAQLATGDFVQFMGSVRLNAGVASIEMFVNGASVGTDSGTGFTSWSDMTENFALGNIDGSATVFSVAGVDPFAGKIAAFRFYDTALSSVQALNNFNAVAGTQAGITVTSTDTSTDSTRGSVTVGTNGSVTYSPNGQFESLAAGATTTDSFRYTVSDGNGNSDTARVTVTITGVNDAPVLTAVSPTLGTIIANENSAATTVSSLLGTSVTDVDTGALRGISVTAATGTGIWQYSTNGTTWVNFGSVSANSSLLLRSTDQIRFAGSGTAAGTATMSYVAWDQSTGTAGAKVDLGVTGRGGTTAWSTNSDTATLTLNRVNLAPTATSDSYTLLEDTTLATGVPGWFNNQWTTRQRLTFNNGAGTALTNQAVLVTLDATRIDYSKTLNNGHDLRFVDGDGTLLDYEIESWDESGTSRVWVRIPQIDAASNTDFVWMYYGNSGAANVQNSGAVWTNQEAVLHMNGTPVDSSSNALTVTTSGATAISGGISASARDFDGVDDNIKLGSSTDLNNIFASGGTISAWINPDGWGEGGYGRIADKAATHLANAGGEAGWGLQVTSAGAILFDHGFGTTQGEWKTNNGVIALSGGWYQITVVYNAGTPTTDPKIFINGVQLAVSEIYTPSGSMLNDSSLQLTIGNHAAATTRTFDGAIDEFRASRTSVTAAQVLADYRSMTGTFTTIGSAEAGPTGVLRNDSDPDGDTLSVASWTNPTRSQAFTMNSDGTFSYTPQANFSGTDSFTYRLTDGTNVLAPVTVTLTVQSVNDAPTTVNVSSSSFAGYTNAAVIGNVTVTDPDAGDTHTITVSDTRFEIVSGQLKLKSGVQINPIAEPTVTLDLVATDSSGAGRRVTTTLTTIDINTSPALSITAITSSVSENTPIGTAVHLASISISDDGIGTNNLSLSGVNAGLFELIGQELYLRAGAIFDHETTATVGVTIEVDDPAYAGSPDDAKVFSLAITDVNEAPSIAITPLMASIAENANSSTFVKVADLTIVDDALGNNQISLVGADASMFSVIGEGLYINTSTLLNFESQTLLTVDLQIDDIDVGGSPDGTVTFSLTVTNVNEAPDAIMDGPYVIAEGQDLTVSAAGSNDPDGDVLTYEWDLDGDSVFDDATGINPTRTWAQLITDSPGVNDDGIRNVRLRVTDAAGLSTVVTTTLTVTNTPPIITVSGDSSVNSGANYILNLSSTDPGQDAITSWTINWGDGSPTETVAGNLSSVSHVYATPGGTRSITVSGTDEDGTHSMTGGPFVVAVNNSAPNNLALSDLRVTEGISGASVARLTFTDVDFGDRHTATVDDTRFEVVNGELRLRSGQSLSHASEHTVPINITVTDLNGASSTAGFVLTVNHVSQGTADSYAVDGTQQLSVSSPSSGVLNNDMDPDNDSMTAVIQSGPANAAAFGMNANGTFWYRARAGFSGVDTFTYFVNDGESNSSPVTVTLTVNQPATLDFVRTRMSIAENTVLNSRLRIGQFVVTDDGIGTNSISIAGTDATFFELDGANVLYLKAGVSLDYEARRSFLVTGQVNDSAIAGDPDNVRNVAFGISNVNEGPITSGILNSSVNEDAGLQLITTAASFHDPDLESLTYTVTTVSQTAGLLDSVSINANTGVLSVQAKTNAFGTAVLRVTATDAAGATVSSQFTHSVIAVNDAPVLLNYSGETFSGQPLTATTPGLLLRATDVDDSSISVVLIQGPSHGTVTIRPDGSFTYTPATGYFGSDSFRFAGSDGQTTGATMTASLFVQAPLVGGGTSGGTSSGNSTGTTTTSSGTATTNSTSGTSSTTSTASSSSGTGNTTGAPAANAIAAHSTSEEDDEQLAIGVSAAANSDDDMAGFVPQVQIQEGDAGRTLATSASASTTATDRDAGRRYSFGEAYTGASGSMSQRWDVHTALTPLELQRQEFYRELAARTEEQIDSFEKKLSRNVSMDGRVVGSVGVVTTGFSVGYLIWAVRGGMLLSGVLSQIPAWTMLDPLMVIDGEGKDDDKESLQTIMDREQARLNKATPPPKT